MEQGLCEKLDGGLHKELDGFLSKELDGICAARHARCSYHSKCHYSLGASACQLPM